MKEKKRKDDIEKLLKEKKDCHIVWGKPGIVRTTDGLKDDLVFSGKNPEKTIDIPFTAIHCKLAESNSIMVENLSGCVGSSNHLVAHIMFVVSKQLYVKTGEKQKYEGGKMFIDFPIIGHYEVLQKIQNSSLSQESHNKACKEDDTIGNYWYESPNGPNENDGHSEKPLIDLLKNNDYIKSMVSCLKDKIQKLHSNYNSSSDEKFKIYAVNLFINSERNICDRCEVELYQLMTSHNQGSFLSILKNELCGVGNAIFETVKKNSNFPYMFISVSASKKVNSTSDYDLNNINAERALFGTQILTAKTLTNYEKKVGLKSGDKRLCPIIDELLNLSIDIKDLSNYKLILSTTVKWLYSSPEEYSEKYEKMNSAKIPFYSGFKSGAGRGISLLSSKLSDYDTLYCYNIKLSDSRNLNLDQNVNSDAITTTTTTTATRENIINEDVELVQNLTQGNRTTDVQFEIVADNNVLLPTPLQYHDDSFE